MRIGSIACLLSCLLGACVTPPSKTDAVKAQGSEGGRVAGEGQGENTVVRVGMTCPQQEVAAGSTFTCTFTLANPTGKSATLTYTLRHADGSERSVELSPLASELMVQTSTVEGMLSIELTASVPDERAATATAAVFVDATPPTPAGFVWLAGDKASSAFALAQATSCGDASSVLWVSAENALSDLATQTAPEVSDVRWQTCLEGANYELPLRSEGNNTLFIWGKDSFGRVGSLPATLSAIRDSQPPVVRASLPGGSISQPPHRRSVGIQFAATDDHLTDAPTRVVVRSASSGADLFVANDLPALGTYWLTQVLPDGAYEIRVSAADSLGNRSAEVVLPLMLDGVAPTITSTIINPDGSAAGAPASTVSLVTVAVAAADNTSATGLRYQLSEVASSEGCTAASMGEFGSARGTTTFETLRLGAIDGTKKVCARVMDEAGNTSAPSSALTTAPDFDTIEYRVSNPPTITSLEVFSTPGSRFHRPGDSVGIVVSARDQEALRANPIELEISTDNKTWTSLGAAVGTLGTDPRTVLVLTQTTAPMSAASYFRIRATAVDATGNTSMQVVSDIQVLGDEQSPLARYSIFAGNDGEGIGGTGRATRLNTATQKGFAVDPTNGDIYAFSRGIGIVRLDTRTGRTSLFARFGAHNLPGDGPLPDPLFVERGFLSFDTYGNLYIAPLEALPNMTLSAVVYQVNLRTRHVRQYLGGGTAIDGGATPNTAFVQKGVFTFDQSNRLLYFASCTPGRYETSGARTPLRLMAAPQLSDGRAGAIEHIAGSCPDAAADPDQAGAFPVNSQNSPLAAQNGATVGAILPIPGTNAIYYTLRSTGPIRVFKIIDGQTYSAALTPHGSGSDFVFDAQRNKILYGPPEGGVSVATPNLLGDGGEVSSVLVTATSSGACTEDGTLATASCVGRALAFGLWPDGTPLFTDAFSVYRIRYIDRDSRLRSVLGTLPFVGLQQERRTVFGTFGGIAWKGNDTPGVPGFRAGLYFVDRQGPLLGRINLGPSRDETSLATANDDLVEALFGNQDGSTTASFASGQSISPALSLGTGARSLAIDPSTNELLLATSSQLLRIGLNGVINTPQSALVAPDYWEDAPTGTATASTHLFRQGTFTNLAPAGTGIFLIGGYTAASRPNTFPTLSYFDFAPQGVVQRLVSAPAQTTPSGQLLSALAVDCLGISQQPGCFLQPTPDGSLWFSEGKKLRRISDPLGARIVNDVATLSPTSAEKITNFTISPSGDRVFYLHGSEPTGAMNLSCFSLGNPIAECNENITFNPPAGLDPLTAMANQFAWPDASTLLVSSGNRVIYRLNLAAN